MKGLFGFCIVLFFSFINLNVLKADSTEPKMDYNMALTILGLNKDMIFVQETMDKIKNQTKGFDEKCFYLGKLSQQVENVFIDGDHAGTYLWQKVNPLNEAHKTAQALDTLCQGSYREGIITKLYYDAERSREMSKSLDTIRNVFTSVSESIKDDVGDAIEALID